MSNERRALVGTVLRKAVPVSPDLPSVMLGLLEELHAKNTPAGEPQEAPQ